MEEYRTLILAAGAAIAVIVAALLLWAIVRRRRRAHANSGPLPLIPFSAGRAGTPPPPPRDGLLPPEPFNRPTAATPRYTRDLSPTNGRREDHARYGPPPTAERAATPVPSSVTGGYEHYVDAGAEGALSQTARPTDLVTGAAVDGASVRYWRPADGTLQFLPGRLEVIAGRDAGQEIRFVRTPGPDGTRVTFGRAEGPPYRHVQLREPTVSRAHARMTLEAAGVGGPDRGDRSDGPNGGSGSRWRLENLSATNPVVVNGRPLAADGGPACSVSLGEGDRIEMGEVVFRFHEK